MEMENVIGNPSPKELVAALRRQIARLEGVRRPRDEGEVSSGSVALDRLLPDGGFRRGTLVEWLAAGEGAGAETLVLRVAAYACRQYGGLVVLDHRREFYPPAAARLGIDLEGMIVVHALGEADYVWALDQALRCPAVAAVLAWPQRLDGRTFRRLQLAAEEGGALGLLLRPESVRGQPSWADVRLLVEPLPTAHCLSAGRRLRIGLLRCRGGGGGGSAEVEINDETCAVHPDPQLARRKASPRAAGA